MMEQMLVEWAGKLWGAPIGIALMVYFIATKKPKDDKTDVVGPLMAKLDVIADGLGDLRERVAKIEGRMDK